jgi:hypothetical protein
MRAVLPFTVLSEQGEAQTIQFPLHDLTGAPEQVGQLLEAILQAITDGLGAGAGRPSNGDVLQALCMATAVRAGMLPTSSARANLLTRQLLETALAARETASTPLAPGGRA